MEKEFKTDLIKVEGSYNFQSSQLDLVLSSVKATSNMPEIIFYEILLKKIKVPLSKTGNIISASLADRHVFDNNFNLVLKYKVFDPRGTVNFEIKYYFWVRNFIRLRNFFFQYLIS